MSPAQLLWAMLFGVLGTGTWFGAHQLTSPAPPAYALEPTLEGEACALVGAPELHRELEEVLSGERAFESLPWDASNALEQSAKARYMLSTQPGAIFSGCLPRASTFVLHQAVGTTEEPDLHMAFSEVVVLWRQSLNAADYCESFRACSDAHAMLSHTLFAMEHLARRAHARGQTHMRASLRMVAEASGPLSPQWRKAHFAGLYLYGRQETLAHRGDCIAFDAALTESIWREHVQEVERYVRSRSSREHAPRLRVVRAPYNPCGQRILGMLSEISPSLHIEHQRAFVSALEERRLRIGLRAY